MKSLIIIFSFMFLINFCSAAHFIVGYVENASDDYSPNGRTVELSNSFGQTLNDIVGPTGNSGSDNIYMFDCEMLTTPCSIGDTLNISLIDDGSGYIGKEVVSVVVTSAGFDMAENITLNTPVVFESVLFDDDLFFVLDEIDLNPGTTKTVTCSSIVKEYDGENAIVSSSAEIYSTATSGVGFGDDNNEHYSNNSCFIDTSYGSEIEAQINCTFEIEYYSNAGDWECFMRATDNDSAISNGTDSVKINELLAIEVLSPLQFDQLSADNITDEKTASVVNYGNVIINLSLNGYGSVEGDGYAMVCDGQGSNNISIEHMKYNTSQSNLGTLTQSELNLRYTNLTANPTVTWFDLSSRQSDLSNDAVKDTFWRVWVPSGSSGTCAGNIIFGAVRAGV